MQARMRAIAVIIVTLMLTLSLAAQTPAGGTAQPDAKAKPAEKPPVGAKTAEPPKAAVPKAGEMPKPAPEIERLLQQLQGRWRTEEKHEPSEMMPQGGTAKGQESVRPGPGKMSLIAEYVSQGPMGEFAGVGLLTWDSAARVYHIHWTDNMNPTVTDMIGKWEGKDLVFTNSEMMMGKKVYSRHAFTELTPSAFTYTIDMGPSAAQLKRSVTIKYSKIDPSEMMPFRRPRPQ